MKTQLLKKILGALMALFACTAMGLHAQTGRGGGYGGGGFGGGGFGGGFGGNRGGFGGGFGGASSANSSEEYNNNGTVGNASIMVDPDTHNIIVVADQQTSDQISNVIANLDRPKPQVLIKVVFLEVQLDNTLDLGVEGGYVNNGSQGNPSVSAANIFGLTGLNNVATNFNALGQPIGAGFPVPSGTSAAGSGGLYQVLGENYQATIRALAIKGKAQVLSRPSILARDGQPATILVGQQVPLVTGISYDEVGNTTVPINNVTYTPVGIQINVTPYVSPDNYVEMIVTPQDSEIDPTQTEPIGGGVNAPVIDTRSADTVVITPDSQTVVIGGLIENDKESSTTQIPLLGDIPLLGALFRYKSSTLNKDELMIFMTPHIVHAPMELSDQVNAPNLTSGFITNSVSEQQLDQFLNVIPDKQGAKGWH